MWSFVTGHDFAVSFISASLAGLLVAIILGLVAFFSGLFNHPQPNLVMVVKQNGAYSDTVLFTKQKDGSYTADFQLAIRNDGDLTLKSGEGFWHTYMMITSTTFPIVAPNEPNHQRKLISYPIYPHYIVDIDEGNVHLNIKKGEMPLEGIPYFFATDYGFFPKTNQFNLATGQVVVSSIGMIKFIIPS